MRAMTGAERTMLLLFARLGEEKPLSQEVYLHMMRMLEILGESEPDRELDLEELRRLGAKDGEARLILSRLERQTALGLHLDYLARRSIRVITRVSPEYPRRLRETLRDRAPMLLYCAGNLTLLQQECVSLVGSRKLRGTGRDFARRLGETAAKEDLIYVSGGAEGADAEGWQAAREAGGGAILFLPDSLERRMERYRKELDAGRLLLVSEDGPEESFSIARAYARNRLIHAMGEKTFVAQSDYGTGGTWQGVMENLRHDWSPLFVCAGEPEDQAVQSLIAMGCTPLLTEELHDLDGLSGDQLKIE